MQSGRLRRCEFDPLRDFSRAAARNWIRSEYSDTGYRLLVVDLRLRHRVRRNRQIAARLFKRPKRRLASLRAEMAVAQLIRCRRWGMRKC